MTQQKNPPWANGRASKKVSLTESTIARFPLWRKALRLLIPAGDAPIFSRSASPIPSSATGAACGTSGLKRPGGSTAP